MTHDGQNPGSVGCVREACRRVAAAARHVRIREDQIPLYAASMAVPRRRRHRPYEPRERDHVTALWLTLDAINFGSGWFPTLHKPPGRTGYHTISSGVRRHFEHRGAWTARQLTRITQAEVARVLAQDPQHELMGLFARSLRNLGHELEVGYGGSFRGPVERAAGSASRLVDILAGWECFEDSSTYDGFPVPFLKRAQIAAADLSRAGVAEFNDLETLTMFADNLVPHVLRLDGILEFEPELFARIDREELIEHGSPEEVEMRACAVHAVELIVAASPVPTTAADVDQLLWHRGQQRLYKARPRHRSRCTAY
jgi:hypothetical protein